MRFFLFLLCALFCFVPLAEAKKSQLYAYSHIANPKYEAMAREALSGMPARFDFMVFRSLYTNTRQYDPLGEDTLEKMNAFAFSLSNETDPEKREQAKRGYQFLVADHLANIGVITQALAYARQDRVFGNPNFFEWMKRGLNLSVMNSRTGRSLYDAYAIVTFPEETVLLANLGVKLLRSEQRHEGFVYYNMDEVEKLKTGEKWTVFVNTTFPMKFLKMKAQEKSDKLKIPRQ